MKDHINIRTFTDKHFFLSPQRRKTSRHNVVFFSCPPAPLTTSGHPSFSDLRPSPPHGEEKATKKSSPSSSPKSISPHSSKSVSAGSTSPPRSPTSPPRLPSAGSAPPPGVDPDLPQTPPLGAVAETDLTSSPSDQIVDPVKAVAAAVPEETSVDVNPLSSPSSRVIQSQSVKAPIGATPETLKTETVSTDSRSDLSTLIIDSMRIQQGLGL